VKKKKGKKEGNRRRPSFARWTFLDKRGGRGQEGTRPELSLASRSGGDVEEKREKRRGPTCRYNPRCPEYDLGGKREKEQGV